MFRIVRLWTGDPRTQALGLKAPAALFDLGVIAALLWLLRPAWTVSAGRVLIYAWSPLPIWEFWGNGHNDAMASFLCHCDSCFGGIQQKSFRDASALLGLATATKWWPGLLIPAFARSRRSVLPYLIVAGVVGALVFLYATDATENAQFMTGFVGGWRNNDSLFGLILYVTGDPYRAKYLTFALIGCATLWLAFRDWPLERITLWTLVTLLLLSANCHPWYLTWIIPLLAFYPHPSLLLWVALVALAHSVQIGWQVLGQWDGSTPDRWWIYIPVFGGFLLEAARAQLKKKNAELTRTADK